MNSNLLATVGISIIVICALITYSKKVPRWLPFAVIPFILCLIAGFKADNVSEWIHAGAQSIVSNVLIAIFALLFFSTLRKTGVFDTIVRHLLKRINGNVYFVYLVAVLMGAIGQLDCSAMTTFFIAVPPLAPLFEEMNLDKKKMLLSICLGAAPINMFPWGTPTSVAAYSMDVDTVQMTRHLIPIIIIAYILVITVVMVCFAYPDWKRTHESAGRTVSAAAAVSEDPLARPQYFAFNVMVLVVFVGALFVFTTIKSYIIFALGTGVLIVRNYSSKEVSEILNEISSDVLNVVLLLFSISFMTGILRNSGIIQSIGEIVIAALPHSMARYLAVAWAWFRPILDCFVPWQTWGSIPPLLVSIGAEVGLTSYQVLSTTCIACFGIPCSPLTAPSLIGCRLAGVNFYEQQKLSAVYNFGLNFVLLVIAVLLKIA